MLEEKGRKAEELEELRRKAEAELRAKEAALAKERRKQDEERRKRFEADYKKYKKIAANQYATEDFKTEAWRILCQKWSVSPEPAVGSSLVYRNGTVMEALPQTVSLPGGTAMEFVWIEPGLFLMGSSASEEGRSDDEGPQHRVTISKGFWLGKHEITQAQWKSVMGNNPSKFRGENQPVEQVSWDDVQQFVRKLNQAEGEPRYRLPTEAEWEYACRAGTTSRWSFGDDERQLGDYAWYSGNNSPNRTKEVGKKRPHPWGLYDMHGNVWEWCQDWFGSYSSASQIDPTASCGAAASTAAPGTCGRRVATAARRAAATATSARVS